MDKHYIQRLFNYFGAIKTNHGHPTYEQSYPLDLLIQEALNDTNQNHYMTSYARDRGPISGLG